MVSISGLDKAAAWRLRIRRFAGSEMTVERFCRREGVSASSFYRWRKLLDEGAPSRRDGRQAATLKGGKMSTASHDVEERSPAFRAVWVTPGIAAVPYGAMLTAHLPGGTRLEVPSGDLAAVRVVVGELLRYDCGQARRAELDCGEPPC